MSKAISRLLEAWGYKIDRKAIKPEAIQETEQMIAANALMGAVPVIGVDGSEWSANNSLWQKINAAIIPRWKKIHCGSK